MTTTPIKSSFPVKLPNSPGHGQVRRNASPGLLAVSINQTSLMTEAKKKTKKNHKPVQRIPIKDTND